MVWWWCLVKWRKIARLIYSDLGDLGDHSVCKKFLDFSFGMVISFRRNDGFVWLSMMCAYACKLPPVLLQADVKTKLERRNMFKERQCWDQRVEKKTVGSVTLWFRLLRYITWRYYQYYWQKNKGNHFGYQVFHHVQLLKGVSRSFPFQIASPLKNRGWKMNSLMTWHPLRRCSVFLVSKCDQWSFR